MKITIVTSLFTKRDMYIYSTHGTSNLHYKLWGIIALCIIIALQNQLYAQQQYELTFNKSIQHHFNPEKELDSLKKLGYLLATYQLSGNDSLSQYKFKFDRRYNWNDLTAVGEDAKAITSYLESLRGQPANQFKLQDFLDKKVKSLYHNDGYPFATALLSISTIEPYFVDAQIMLDKRVYIRYDSLVLNSEIIRNNYLQNFLNLREGHSWSSKAVDQIENKLEVFDFIVLQESPQFFFFQGKSKISLKLDKKKTSQLDGVLGVIPSDNGTMVTGQADIHLSNLFRAAMGLDMKWRKFNQSSQSFLVGLQQFKSFGTPLGFQFNFSLLKQDSSFLNTDFEFLTNYMLKPNIVLDLGYHHYIGNTQTVSQENIQLISDPIRSARISSMVLGFSVNQKDRYPQLKDLFYFNGKFVIGQKEILNYESLAKEWKQVPKRSLNTQLSMNLGFQQKLSERITIEEVLSTHTIFNKAIAKNDYLRLGGLQTLRGFDQYFYYTRNYQLLNVNARYFLNNSSSFLLISDLAYLNKQIDFVVSAGFGLDLKTNNGWFRLICALGKQSNESLNISAAKVHFGYIALF